MQHWLKMRGLDILQVLNFSRSELTSVQNMYINHPLYKKIFWTSLSTSSFKKIKFVISPMFTALLKLYCVTLMHFFKQMNISPMYYIVTIGKVEGVFSIFHIFGVPHFFLFLVSRHIFFKMFLQTKILAPYLLYFQSH